MADMNDNAGGSPLLACPRQHGLERVAVVRRDLRQQIAAAADAKRANRRPVGLGDPQVIDPQQKYRLDRSVEQQPVPGFDLAQLPIILLHRLLRSDQAGLQFHHRLQAAADREQAVLAADAYGRVLDRQFAPAGEALVDLAERRDACAARVVDDARDLAATQVSDGVRPGPPTPGLHLPLDNGT